jgi:hypothetical protein
VWPRESLVRLQGVAGSPLLPPSAPAVRSTPDCSFPLRSLSPAGVGVRVRFVGDDASLQSVNIIWFLVGLPRIPETASAPFPIIMWKSAQRQGL